ncbi:hypothetical protein CK203_045754 [Vitis vinifera]|uniref:Uncharacterized protein n=1 Tax=Vitis vinifera TaxID=29760 RepID=A0A438I143_VITVI|nr:hypothetical protein CK203_045754 [Vitis vinifera]
MSEKLFGGLAEAKEPQKRHVQGSDGRNRYEGWLVGVRRGWRRKRVAGKWLTCPHAPAREMQSSARKTRVAGAWVVFWLRCFGKNWRSPPGAPCGDRNETRSQEDFPELMTRGNWKELANEKAKSVLDLLRHNFTSIVAKEGSRRGGLELVGKWARALVCGPSMAVVSRIDTGMGMRGGLHHTHI